MKIMWPLFFLLIAGGLHAQQGAVFHIDSLPEQGIILDKGWKWHAGDNPEWAQPDYDDSGWEAIDPTLDIFDLPQLSKTGEIGWFRLRIKMDTSAEKQVFFTLLQSGASEWYLHGKQIYRFGELGPQPDKVEAFCPACKLMPIAFDQDTTLVLAVRYALQPNVKYTSVYLRQNPAFQIRIYNSKAVTDQYEFFNLTNIKHSNIFRIGAFLMLFIGYLSLYFFYPQQKANLYFSLFSLLILAFDIAQLNLYCYSKVENYNWTSRFIESIHQLSMIPILTALYYLLDQKKSWRYWSMIILIIFSIVLLNTVFHPVVFIISIVIISNLVNIEIVRIALKSLKTKKRGAWIISAGGISFLFFWTMFILLVFLFPKVYLYPIAGSIYTVADLTYNLSLLSIPVAVSIYSGLEIALTNRSLQQKLLELERLSSEKQKILASQNDLLERQVEERTAELQQKNRELEIEAALERVRANTMAMHKSEELQEIVNSMFSGWRDLNIEVDTANILIYSELNQDMECWTTNYHDRSFHIPHAEVGVLIDLYEAKQSGQKLFSKSYSIEEKNRLFEYFFEKTDFNTIPQDRKELILSATKYAISVAFFGNVGVQLTSFSRDAFSENDNNILLRFSSVFYQAYVRFLDLQRAEARAREVLIEAALEKVRSQTMAMGSSDDVSLAIATMFAELQMLGVDNLRCGIAHIFQDKTMGIWSVNNIANMKTARASGVFNMNAHILWQFLFEGWEKGKDFFHYFLAGKEKEEYINILNTTPDYLPQPIREFPDMNFQAYFFAEGAIWTFSLHPHSPADKELMKRFTTVFSLTFRRYQDLMKAEARVVESVRAASLDRLRAEISSMRKPEDLQRITPLVWRELTTLDVPFFRCGVFIIDEALERVHAYLSTPDGKSLGVLYLPFNDTETTRKIVGHWRQGEAYSDFWTGEQFHNWVHSITSQGFIEGSQTYQGGEEPPESLSLQFVPFTQGMLYIGSLAPLSKDQVDLLQRLAGAFAIAYARFEDFARLEEAKRKVEITLTELTATQAQLIQSEKLASLGQLTAGIAHEIKNPLNFVKNFAELSQELFDELLEEVDQENWVEVKAIVEALQQNLGKIGVHSSRADSIVRSMLLHSRGGSGKSELTDLNQFIREYVNLAFHGMRAGKQPINVSIELDLDERAGEVPLVVEDFSRVILNLCHNAFDAMRGKISGDNGYQPKLTVQTRRSGEGIAISVEDNGPGISADIRDKVLQPFFTTKKGTEGTGLGLSVSHDIVKAHGGRLLLDTTPGLKTRFTIELPNSKTPESR